MPKISRTNKGKTTTNSTRFWPQNGLIKAMRKLLPIYHGFEDLGVLFYSQTFNRLYTVMELDNNDEVVKVEFVEYGLNKKQLRSVPIKYIKTVNGEKVEPDIYDHIK